MDQYPGPILNLCDPVEHLVGGGVIEHQAQRLRGIQPRRYRNQFRRQHHVLAVPSSHGKSRNCIPDLEAGNAATCALDHPDDVVTRYIGQRRNPLIQAIPHQDISVSDAGSQHSDSHFMRLRIRQISVD
jgi:hypothetical protein